MTATDFVDATWPAESMRRFGPFVLREGSGGRRCAAATCEGEPDPDLISAVEAAMREPIFRVHAGQEAFDRMLADRGYLVIDPTLFLACSSRSFPAREPVTGFTAWPPLAVQRDIWSEGGIGSDRLCVMDRVAGPKTTILGRAKDSPGGTAFVAAHGDTALVHALYVRAPLRRVGLGRQIMCHAGNWAVRNGADRLGVLVTRANAAAVTFYRGLGMDGGACYHYRIRP